MNVLSNRFFGIKVIFFLLLMAVCAAALSVAPTAKNQSASIVNGRVRMPLEPLSCSPLGSNLEFAAVVLPSHGKLEYQARSGEWKAVVPGVGVSWDEGGADYCYTPEPGYTGSDFFTWIVSNGEAVSNIATYSITAAAGAMAVPGRLAKSMAVNMIPVAYDIKNIILKNQPSRFPVSYNDTDRQTMTVSIVSQPLYGTVTASNATLFYNPSADFTGADSFTWNISDGIAGSNTATARILVKEPASNAGMLVLLVVNATLLPKITSEVTRLKTDLENEGYTSKIKSWSGSASWAGGDRELWEYLKSEYDNPSQFVSGAILIGDMPTATNVTTNEMTDYVFMNMVEFRNITRRHIWVSRICAASGDEVKQLKRVFQANHDYRTGASRLPHKAYYFEDGGLEGNIKNQGENALLIWPEKEWARPSVAMRKGGELLDETMHGSALGSDFFHYHGGHPSQIRFGLFTSCGTGGFGGPVHKSYLTYGGGNIFSISASQTTYTGAFVILGYDTTVLSRLAAGETWGNTIVYRIPGNDCYRAMIYGDLSTRVKLYPSNKLPVISSLTEDKTTGVAPLTVNFTASASDTDGTISRYEWFVNGFNSGADDPVYSNSTGVCTHTYTLPHRYPAEVQVVDNYLARAWTSVDIVVAPIPGEPLRVNCGYSVANFIPGADYTSSSGKLWLHDQSFGYGEWWVNKGPWGYCDGSERYLDNYQDVANTEDDTLYQRFITDDSISYKVLIANGNYMLNLGFADMLSSSSGTRVMDVSVEGKTMVSGLDVYAVSGPKTAQTISLYTEVIDGELDFTLRKNIAAIGPAFLSCFEVLPYISGNRPPMAESRNIKTPQNTQVQILLTATDPDGDPMTYMIVNPPAHGILTGNAPILTYTPTDNVKDQFTFKANDGKTDGSIGAVVITKICLSTGCAVTASSSGEYGANWGKTGLTDGTLTRGYTNDCSILSGDEWVEIDLGGDKSFSRVILTPRYNFFTNEGKSPDFPADFTITARTSAGVQTTLVTKTDYPSPDSGAPQEFNFDLVTARYVRLTVTKFGIQQDECRLQLAEMEIIDKNNVANETTLPSPLYFGLAAMPNPFAASTLVKFNVPQSKNGEKQKVSVRIYDLNGKLVQTLAQGMFAVGYHTAAFNSREKGNGRTLGNGIYCCRMQAPGFTKTLKLLLVE